VRSNFSVERAAKMPDGVQEEPERSDSGGGLASLGAMRQRQIDRGDKWSSVCNERPDAGAVNSRTAVSKS